MLITFAAAMIWLRANDFFAHKGWMSGPMSRKVIHIGTGPIFVLCWLLFNDRPEARFLAALIPAAITVQFALVGLGILKDPAAVVAMSRTGDRREILKGPLFYGIAFVVLTLVFWKDTPVGMVALMMMCGGDGLADIIGKRLRSPKLPWSTKKTLAGTLAVFFGGCAFTLAVLAAHIAGGTFPGPLTNYLAAVLVIGFAVTLVESLPMPDVDNLTVTGVAALLGLLLF